MTPTVAGSQPQHSSDPAILFPASDFVNIPEVAVFDEHEGPGHGGKPKKVTAKDLQRLADSCNKKFIDVRAATSLALGHTKDGDVAESNQPLIVGWATDFKVAPLLKTGRQALYCTWHVRKKYAHVISEYPHRSIEWWRDRDDIEPISLLRTAPERPLPILKYGVTPDPDSQPYRYVFSPPTDSTMTDDDKKDMAEAVTGETSTNKGLAAKVDQLASQVGQLSQMFEQLLGMLEQGGDEGEGAEAADDADAGEGKDLLAPADAEDDKEDKAKAKAKKDDKDAEDDEEPEKYEADAGYAGPTNAFTPSTEKKTKMARETDDVAKYERKIAESVARATETLRRENADLRVQYNRNRAKDAVAELEQKYKIDFGAEAEREEELTLFADLLAVDSKGDSFQAHFDKVAKKYKRKTDAQPDSNGVSAAAKYARTGDGAPTFQSADDVAAYISAWSQDNNLTREKWAEKNGKKAR